MVKVLMPVTLAALAGLIYAWVLTYRESRAAEAPGWRQTVAWLSVGAVTLQVLLFAGMYFFFSNGQRAINSIAEIEVLLVLIAVPCAVMRKGFARWWLIFSSVYFLAFAWFIYIVSGIVF